MKQSTTTAFEAITIGLIIVLLAVAFPFVTAVKVSDAPLRYYTRRDFMKSQMYGKIVWYYHVKQETWAVYRKRTLFGYGWDFEGEEQDSIDYGY